METGIITLLAASIIHVYSYNKNDSGILCNLNDEWLTKLQYTFIFFPVSFGSFKKNEEQIKNVLTQLQLLVVL